MKLSDANMLLLVDAHLTALNGDCEYGVGAGAVEVHLRCTHRPWGMQYTVEPSITDNAAMSMF